jgi:hypothetical protein
MRFVILLVASILVVAIAGTEVQACDCAAAGRPCEEYWRADAVFSGTVIDSRTVTVKEESYARDYRVVRLSIDSAFRGVEGAEVEVLTGFGGGDCGFGFRQTEHYLVYAYRSERDHQLYTSICTRTRLLSKAEDDLAYIRDLSKLRPGGEIDGEVARYHRDAKGTLANQPLANIIVRLEGPQKYETLSDQNGRYSFASVVAGEYVIKPVAPRELALRGPDRKVTVADRGCAEVSFWLESSASLSGRVLNAQGLPIAKAEVFMLQADAEKYAGHWDAAYADEDGKYVFKLVPPGSYVLTIRYDGLTSQTRPFPLMYYPGVTDKAQAKVFTIREGQPIDNFDLVMPPLPPEDEIVGNVVWPDGTPAANARVVYEVDAVVYGVPADAQGRFSFKAYQGLKLALGASVEVEKGKYANSGGVRVIVGTDSQPIKMVLRRPEMITSLDE